MTNIILTATQLIIFSVLYHADVTQTALFIVADKRGLIPDSIPASEDISFQSMVHQSARPKKDSNLALHPSCSSKHHVSRLMESVYWKTQHRHIPTPHIINMNKHNANILVSMFTLWNFTICLEQCKTW